MTEKEVTNYSFHLEVMSAGLETYSYTSLSWSSKYFVLFLSSLYCNIIFYI